MDVSAQSTPRPRLATINAAAVYAGTSRATLYAEKKAGRISFVKIGNATRVEYDELDRWIDAVSKTAA